MKKRNLTVIILWLLIICGFSFHSILDILPIFWSKSVAISTDGIVPQGMMIIMAIISYVIPVICIFFVMFGEKLKSLLTCNMVLATIMAIFNVLHTCLETPSENKGQYFVFITMIAISFILVYQSIKLLKELQTDK